MAGLRSGGWEMMLRGRLHDNLLRASKEGTQTRDGLVGHLVIGVDFGCIG